MDDYISRTELLKEINLATWDTEGDKAEAHYIATQIEPIVLPYKLIAEIKVDADEIVRKYLEKTNEEMSISERLTRDLLSP